MFICQAVEKLFYLLQKLVLLCLIQDSVLLYQISSQVQLSPFLWEMYKPSTECRPHKAEAMSPSSIVIFHSLAQWLAFGRYSINISYYYCYLQYQYDMTPAFLTCWPWTSMASPQSMLEMLSLRPHTSPAESESAFAQDPQMMPFLIIYDC